MAKIDKMNHIKKELQIFLTAVMFYTRIPCPKWVDHSEEYLNKATRYFPVIGWIVGSIAALVFIGANYLFSLPVALLLSMAASVLVTGAFHEDGFADVCDGFGGGWTKEKILLIMKDSRVGAYGVIGIILLLSIKIAALYEIACIDTILCCKVLLMAHTCSRFAAVILRKNLEYVRENEDSKAKPIAKQTSNKDYFIAFMFTLIPLVLFKTVIIFLLFIPVILLVFYLRYYLKKWIGGYTGDCLGATQQLAEIVIYLSLLALWKFI